jgi:DNA-directed RNA polymerase specialized sigma24 family protein
MPSISTNSAPILEEKCRSGDFLSSFPKCPPDERMDDLLDVHEALDELERDDPQAAALVKLRFFAGFEHQEAAEILGLSRRAADRVWLLARTWLYQHVKTHQR